MTTPSVTRLDSAGASRNTAEYAGAVDAVLASQKQLNAGVDSLVASLAESAMAPAVAAAGEQLKSLSTNLANQHLQKLHDGLSGTNTTLTTTDADNKASVEQSVTVV